MDSEGVHRHQSGAAIEREGSPSSGRTTPQLSEMDHVLEDLAERKNLSVMNVKSLIRVSA